MRIKYVDGPAKIDAGEAGSFRIGEEREIPDELAERLLAKTSVTFKAVKDKKGKEER